MEISFCLRVPSPRLLPLSDGYYARTHLKNALCHTHSVVGRRTNTTTTPCRRVLCILRTSSITEALPSDCLVPYPGHTLVEVLPRSREAVGVFYSPSRLGNSHTLTAISHLPKVKSTYTERKRGILLSCYMSYGTLIPTDKIKRDFFQAVAVSTLLYGCTTWTLTTHKEKN